jgi:Restriction endonuclease XhoI
VSQESLLEKNVRDALNTWVTAREEQLARSTAGGRAQQGNRAAVVGAKHLDGINDLISRTIEIFAGPGLEFRAGRAATLPGYYRASKNWDLVVVRDGVPVLAIEYKSMVGSEGKNLNNRADEIFGMAEDVRQAEAHGLLPRDMKRAYVFIMGITPESTNPVGASTRIGTLDPVFEGASYLDRAAIMCERMRETGLFDLVWMIGVDERTTESQEPRPAVGWRRFEEDLAKLFAPPTADNSRTPRP